MLSHFGIDLDEDWLKHLKRGEFDSLELEKHGRLEAALVESMKEDLR